MLFPCTFIRQTRTCTSHLDLDLQNPDRDQGLHRLDHPQHGQHGHHEHRWRGGHFRSRGCAESGSRRDSGCRTSNTCKGTALGRQLILECDCVGGDGIIESCGSCTAVVLELVLTSNFTATSRRAAEIMVTSLAVHCEAPAVPQT